MHNTELIAILQDKIISIVEPLLKDTEDVALLDYPNHPNVGDCLIWLGEQVLLKRLGKKICYICDYRNFNEAALRASLKPNSGILIHGGGNFGTLWPWYQEFRENVVRRFPAHKIIQLPQSIHYDLALPDYLKTSKDTISRHPNFTLLVRDVTSEEFAKNHFKCQVILCPDTAFLLGALKRHEPTEDAFCLLRTDKETTLVPGNAEREASCLNLSIKFGDWLTEWREERITAQLIRMSNPFLKYVDPQNKFLGMLWNHLAEARLRRGVKILSQGGMVITDRLHAHILSLLLNINHVALDNCTGKISSLIKAWTSDYNGVRLATSWDDAVKILPAFLASDQTK